MKGDVISLVVYLSTCRLVCMHFARRVHIQEPVAVVAMGYAVRNDCFLIFEVNQCLS